MENGLDRLTNCPTQLELSHVYTSMRFNLNRDESLISVMDLSPCFWVKWEQYYLLRPNFM